MPAWEIVGGFLAGMLYLRFIYWLNRKQRAWQGSHDAPIQLNRADSKPMRVFDITAGAYDLARRRLIPGFEKFYATAVAQIPEGADHILDLGAGTGLLSLFVRQRFPGAYLHLVDSSKPMLDQARERFSRDQEVAFQLGDYTQVLEPRGYDAVVSALSIHHLTDEAKRQTFGYIYQALRPGGMFINAEQVLAPTPEQETEAQAEWLVEVRASGATEDEIGASLMRQKEDRCATVAEQMQWMQQAGFGNVHCAYARGRFAVLAGSR